MFTLFKSPPKFPVVKPVNIRQIQNYLRKFEESIKASEEIQKEAMHSWNFSIRQGYGIITFIFCPFVFIRLFLEELKYSQWVTSILINPN